MGMFFIAAVICALAGAWLAGDFLYWYFASDVVPGTIERFEDGKPVMGFTTAEGEKLSVKASRITHASYMLANAQPGEIFNTAYIKDGMGKVTARVSGFLHLLAGAILFLPLLSYTAIEYGEALMESQVSFIVIFTVIVTGCWAGLKLLRRNY